MNTNMDFRPNQGRRRRTKKGTSPLVVVVPAALLLGLFAVHTHTSNEIDRLNQEITAFKEMGREYDEAKREYDLLRQRQSRISRTLSLVESLAAEDASYTELIDRLTARLPGITSDRQAYVRTLNLSETRITIFDNSDPAQGDHHVGVELVGNARTPDAVASLMQDFEDDPRYEALLHRVNQAGEEYEFRMELVALLEAPGKERP